jgi:hypothetical protein
MSFFSSLEMAASSRIWSNNKANFFSECSSIGHQQHTQMWRDRILPPGEEQHCHLCMHACMHSTKNTRTKLTRWLTDTKDNKSSKTITALLHLHHRFSSHPPTEILFCLTAAKITAKIRVTNLYQIQVTRCKWVLSVFLFSCTRCKWVLLVFHILEESAKICTSPFHPHPLSIQLLHSSPKPQTRQDQKKKRQTETNRHHKNTNPFPHSILLLKFCVWFLPLNFLPSFLPSFLTCSPQSSTSYTSDFFSLLSTPTNTHTCSILLNSVLLLKEWMNEWNGFLSFFAPTPTISFFVGFVGFFFCFFVFLLGEYWVLFEGF